MHWFKHFLVAVDYHLSGATALNAVAGNHANESVIGFCIHKHLNVHHITKTRVAKHQDAFNNHHIMRPHGDGFFLSRASEVGISGHFDTLVLLQHFQMLKQQFPIKCSRLVEVDVLPLFGRHMAGVFIVIILTDNSHFALGKAIHNFLHYCCFSRTGAAGNAYDKHNS